MRPYRTTSSLCSSALSGQLRGEDVPTVPSIRTFATLHGEGRQRGHMKKLRLRNRMSVPQLNASFCAFPIFVAQPSLFHRLLPRSKIHSLPKYYRDSRAVLIRSPLVRGEPPHPVICKSGSPIHSCKELQYLPPLLGICQATHLRETRI